MRFRNGVHKWKDQSNSVRLPVNLYFSKSLRHILNDLQSVVPVAHRFIIATGNSGYTTIRLDNHDAGPVGEVDRVRFSDLIHRILQLPYPYVSADIESDGSSYDLMATGTRALAVYPIRLDNGSTFGVLCAAHSVPYDFSETELQTLQLTARLLAYFIEIENSAMRDPLTGAHNRAFFDSMRGSFDMEFGHSFALVYIDLDGFKLVNDENGHDVGDDVLKVAVQRIQRRIRNDDLIIRIGGDEFVVILTDMSGSPSDLQSAVDRLRDCLNEAYLLHGKTISVQASLGFVSYPDDGKDLDTLLKLADSAMYAEKRNLSSLDPSFR